METSGSLVEDPQNGRGLERSKLARTTDDRLSTPRFRVRLSIAGPNGCTNKSLVALASGKAYNRDRCAPYPLQLAPNLPNHWV